MADSLSSIRFADPEVPIPWWEDRTLRFRLPPAASAGYFRADHSNLGSISLCEHQSARRYRFVTDSGRPDSELEAA